MNPLKTIRVRDRNPEFIHEVQLAIERHKANELVHVIAEVGDIFKDDDWDALVSPANSFGFMNGGIDGVYTRKYGQELEDRVRERIALNTTFNELLVGMAMVVPITEEKDLIVAPTMRVPLPITHTPENVYLAARAAAYMFRVGAYRTMLIPGMGTATGNIPAYQAARNMVNAFVDVFNDNYAPVFDSCNAAWLNHQKYGF